LDTNTSNANYFAPTQQGQGANGAGIEPIWMASFTDFLLAEAALELSTTGEPRDLLISGVRKSINRVRSWSNSKGQTLAAGVEPSQAIYEAIIGANYDAANNNTERLDIIAKEYYIALWGNGVEAYNLYRRTGMPLNMQPTRAINGGSFYRSFTYPADFINLNGSTEQKANPKVQVFWDNNPADFIY
jgi:hypothetical protein